MKWQKIIFPFYKERYKFLSNRWWFRFVIVVYIIGFVTTPFVLFGKNMESSTDWCYDSLQFYGNDLQGFNEQLIKCSQYARDARLESLILAIGGTFIFHYLIQFIFFKIAMDYIILGGRVRYKESQNI